MPNKQTQLERMTIKYNDRQNPKVQPFRYLYDHLRGIEIIAEGVIRYDIILDSVQINMLRDSLIELEHACISSQHKFQKYFTGKGETRRFKEYRCNCGLKKRIQEGDA